MKVLSLAAPANGSGKTSLLCSILAAFPGEFAAAKFTTVYKDGKNCPRTDRDCACRRLHGTFRWIVDPETLEEEDTDTGRIAASGATSVHWCVARPGAYGEAVRHGLDEFLGDPPRLATEGSRVLGEMPHDLLVFVVRPDVPRSRWKEDADRLLREADQVVVNWPEGGWHDGEGAAARSTGTTPGARERAIADLGAKVSEIVRARKGAPPASVIVGDVTRPLASWNPDLVHRIEEVFGVHAAASR